MTADRATVWRFYAYRVSVSNGFWVPVGVLYMKRVHGLGLDEVGLVMGGFTVAMVVAEVPTGYVGDRLGRRAALVIGNLVLGTFMVGHALVETTLGFLGLYVFWSFGWAFRSGTADAWLYELLAAGGEADEFARVRGRAATVQKAFEAGTAAVAGGLVVLDWRLPFLANAAVAACGIPLLLTAPSVNGRVDDAGATGDAFALREAVAVLRVRLSRPDVRWFVAYSALFSAFYQVARDFEQPAMDAVGVPTVGFGLVYAGFKLASAGAASTAGWFGDRLGPRGVFALLVPVYALAFLGVAAVPLLVVPVLTLNRSVMSVVGPVRNQYVNDRVGDRGRATVLSGVSMVLLLSGGVAKLLGGVVAESVGLLRFLAVGGVAVAGVAGLLWLAVTPVRPVEGSAPAGEEAAASD